MQMKFRLFGAHAGATVILSGTYFENGLATVEETPENLGHLQRALLYYRAYVEGSPEYDAAVEEFSDGNRSEVHEEAGSGDSERLLGEHDSPSGGTTDETSAQRPGDVETPGGDERLSPEWGGHEHPGLAEQPTEGDIGDGEPDQGLEVAPPEPEPADPNARDIDWKLTNVIDALDPDVDGHWTKGGLPMITAVEEAYGSGEVTRALVEKAKPGWTRELAVDEKASVRSNDIEF